jgi:hypothetical protein
MDGYEFKIGRWQNVPWFLDQVQELYATKVVPKGGPGIWKKTAEVLIRERKWETSSSLFKAHIEAILEEQRVMYVPRVLAPGPGLIFPQLDVRDNYIRARFRPMYDLTFRGTVAKYAAMGDASLTVGPGWHGMSHRAIDLILKHHTVVLVEGPCDYLACRLVAPDVPVLSTGTKTWNEQHVAHLRMLGVKTVQVMFDQDEAGQNAASFLTRTWNAKLDGRLTFHGLGCPASDPSDCLTRLSWAKALRTALLRTTGQSTIEIDEM